MKKVTLMFVTLFVVMAFYSQINAQLLLKDKFDYPAGTTLISSGWVHTGNSTKDTLKTVAGNLTYGFYPYSTTTGSNMVLLQGKVAAEDVHKNFANKVTSGIIYTSFLVRVDTTTDTSDYFFHYYSYSSSVFKGKLFVKDNKAGKFTFGLSKSSNTATFTTNGFDYKKTYLVVVKYEIVGDTTGTDDKVSLFINPGATEPTNPNILIQNTTDADVNIYGVALRQGSGASYKVNVDGFRTATMWDSLSIDKAAQVTFQVNMSRQIATNNFTAGKDTLVVRGDFQSDALDSNSNWSGKSFKLTDADNNQIYTGTVDLPASKAGTKYEYKYAINTNGWETISPDHRSFTFTPPASGAQELPVVYFSNAPYAGQEYTIHISADLSSIYGTGIGHFDPAKDSLVAMGFDWYGAKNVSGRTMKESLGAGGTFEATVKVTATSDHTEFKFKAFPDNHFGDNGWEQNLKENRRVDFGEKTDITVPMITPIILTAGNPTTKEMKVLFQVDMSNAKNAYDNSPIPVSDIKFVGVKGAPEPLGKWSGSWVPADTGLSPKGMLPMNDSGIKGDKKAGDNIWSLEVTFPAGSTGGSQLFKYGCDYKGVETHTTKTEILDNEAGFAMNHSFQLNDNESGKIELKAAFGNMTTGVKELKDSKIPTVYSLTQNYPNPFNPSTSIRYAVPQAGMVTLKIFNMLGQEVATLVHAQQNAGSYEVSFDASRLSSGIYLYNLTSGAFSSTKKMMLVK